MKDLPGTYGAARLGGRLHAVRVENDGGRRQVTSLLTAEEGQNASFGEGRLFFNVGDRLAVVKKLRVRHWSGVNAAEVAQFEMMQTLLEPAEAYYFDALPLEAHGGFQRYLSIAYHRSVVDKLIEAYREKLRRPSGFKLDAVALAQGYLNFCRVSAGDLVALADFESDGITLVLLYRRRLEAIGRMDAVPGDEITVDKARELALEFKITIDFHLAELSGEGITVPLSRIFLCGGHARNDILRAALAEVAPTELVLPEFHEGYFRRTAGEQLWNYLERFLIPLGLAVE